MSVSYGKAAFGAMCMAVAIGLMGAAPAAAQEAYGPRIVHLSVIDRDTGQTKKVYLHDRRYYVGGDTGRRFSLRVENVSSERVLVVLSVDGVNVLSGETADFNQRGYILAPHQWADINGWRKSETQVAAFRFAPLPQSYAARTGRPGDVGVIGMAVFRERRLPPPIVAMPSDRRAERGAPPAPPAPPPPPVPSPVLAPQRADAATEQAARDMAPPPARTAKLGTAHGEIETDISRIEPFERASYRPDSVRLIEYDSVDNLVAAGVIPAGSPETRRPRPFPGRSDPAGYVPDPPPARY